MAETVTKQRRQLVCNFRAPSLKEYGEWQEFKRYVKSQGLDVCRVTIGLANAFMAGAGGSASVQGHAQTVNIQMNNQFLYQVPKPRREPYTLDYVFSSFRRTFSSVLFEAYVLHKARELGREFCFRDFLELEQPAFHRIVLRLRRKGKLLANPQRTNPASTSCQRTCQIISSDGKNTVKQLFTTCRLVFVFPDFIPEVSTHEKLF